MSALPPGFVLDSAPQQGPVYGPPPKAPTPPAPPTQLQINADSRAEAAAALQRERFAYEQQQDALKNQPKGPTADPKLAGKAASLDSVVTQINRVQELYDNNLRDEALPLLSSLWEYLPTPTNNQFDSAGAALGDQGMAAFKVPGMGPQSDQDAARFVTANQPQASDSDLAIEEKLRSLRQRVDANRAAMGLLPAQWGAAPVQEQQDPAMVAGNVGGDTPQGGSGYGTVAPTPPPFSPGDPQMQAAQGTRTEEDPVMAQVAGQYRQMLAENRPTSEIIQMLRGAGASPQTMMAAVAQIKYRREHPQVPIEKYSITSQREVPISAAEQTITDLGSGGAGAYAIGAGQFLSGNTLDNVASDPERARLAMGVAQANNPGSYAAGEFTGGMLAGLTGEAGLARLGMAGGVVRGAAADGLSGFANGAGMADGPGDSRISGGFTGALSQGVGSLAGGAAIKGVGRALSPSGGSLADLYAAGVRPTPGQRFANSGTVGGLVNAAEEHLQSVPVIGTAIRGARQGARDQFQVGAFNEALKEIGETLPKGMKPGTDPHKFAQQAFGRIYDEARSGMRVVADEELTNEITALAPDISTLGPQAQQKLRAIMANTIKDDLSGDAYKRAMSDLGKHIARLGKSAMGEEQQLADVLTSVRNALDGAARRHSDPEAVRLLDAADAGYAKLVRIEEAAQRRGGDPGTFTPNNFDSAVQKSSGGVRSKAYLRGDALMGDFAEQGKSLSDRVPNSGTPERQMTGMVATGGLGLVSPKVLGLLGGIGALYAPGVRKVTAGVFAPSAGKRAAIASKLKRIERLGAGATGALALQGTTPGQ